jgi:hypothetical protein
MLLLDFLPLFEDELSAVASIRQAIALALQGITTLNVYEEPPVIINTPAAFVRREKGPEFDGANEYVFLVTLLASLSDTTGGQDKIDGYLSPATQAVEGAINADPTLGGVVHYTSIQTVSPVRVTNYAAADYLTADISLEVGAA